MKDIFDARRSGSGGLGRMFLAIVFVSSGLLHFAVSDTYLKIMPPYLPQPLLLVYLSGIAELLGGLGLLVAPTRRAAAWGLIVLLIAVWPANIYMAMAHLDFPGILGQSWAQWLRVPLQIPMILWTWRYTREPHDVVVRRAVP